MKTPSFGALIAVLYLYTPSFAAIPPTPTNPSPGSVSSPGPTMSSSTVTLSWNASTGATYYDVGVRNMATNNLVVATTTTSTSYTASLQPGTPYRWNVAADNADGESAFTTRLYFTTPAQGVNYDRDAAVAYARNYANYVVE